LKQARACSAWAGSSRSPSRTGMVSNPRHCHRLRGARR
jgi:hypothetical protein